MPIRVLPPQLVSQIAAGEIVDRPASVVKELVENSLDAGATCVYIDIEQGGLKLIRIRDDGCGIQKNELPLALSRHATSKIVSLQDLDTLTSLGFRGEALSSISSVSRLALTSKTSTQEAAWQIYSEGQDSVPFFRPIAHPCGTTIEINDLFYNTPVRRKSLRTEKTEFWHIEEVIRRMALANSYISISLSHNNKLVHNYRAFANQRSERLKEVLGDSFLHSTSGISFSQRNISLRGRISNRSMADSLSKRCKNIQYCCLNGRIVHDKIVGHAINQAFQIVWNLDQKPNYVVYLEINPDQIDVNIHPTKREIKFLQPRLVHDFVYQGIIHFLHLPSTMDNESIEPYTTMTRKSSKTKSHYCQESSHRKSFHHINRKNLISRSHCFFGSVLAVIHKQYALISHDSELLLVSLPAAIGLLESTLFESQASLRKLRSKPLLIPACVKISSPERYFLKSNTKLLSKIGINLILESNYVKLLKVPYILIEQSLYDFVPKLVQFLQVQGKDTIKMTDWLIRGSSKVSSDWSLRQATLLLTELDRLRPNLITSGLSNLVQVVMIEETIKALHPV